MVDVTLGIEEEFQLVNPRRGRASNSASALLDVNANALPIKGEFVQTMIELFSPVFANAFQLSQQYPVLVKQLEALALHTGYMQLIRSGTHPTLSWHDAEITQAERYINFDKQFPTIARECATVSGLHIHIGLQNLAAGTELWNMRIILMNHWLSWYALLLRAFTANSPFWQGSFTENRSHRTAVWKRMYRTRAPRLFTPLRYRKYIQGIQEAEGIDDPTVWWDVRPHPLYPTLEIRSCDTPASSNDTIDAALIAQAIVYKQALLYQRGKLRHPHPYDYLDHNMATVVRNGLDALLFDFVKRKSITARDAIDRELAWVDDVLDDLGSRAWIEHIRQGLATRKTGADLQIEAYTQSLMMQNPRRYSDDSYQFGHERAIYAVLNHLCGNSLEEYDQPSQGIAF